MSHFFRDIKSPKSVDFWRENQSRKLKIVVKMRLFEWFSNTVAYWIEFAVVCPPPSKQILCESLVFTKACYAAFSLHFRYKIRTRLDYRLKSTVFWNNVQKCLFWIFTPKITFVPFVSRIFPNVWIFAPEMVISMQCWYFGAKIQIIFLQKWRNLVLLK